MLNSQQHDSSKFLKSNLLYLFSFFMLLNLAFEISSNELKHTIYGDIDTYSASNNLNMVIEIPAGTNKKIEYDYPSNTFKIDLIDNKERVIDFLPYPGNYGYVPSTNMNVDQGGDGDALDIILISQSIGTGTIIEVIPIGIILLSDSGENDSKIIAIPANKDLRVINADNYINFSNDYPAIKDIIKLFFLNYKKNNPVKFISWGDEKKAVEQITKWSLK